jgi:small-conductance mechanosensitive channel
MAPQDKSVIDGVSRDRYMWKHQQLEAATMERDKRPYAGDTARIRSIEAADKLLTVLFLFVAGILGLQAIGLDIQSVLAISGFGGLALGLAGREILENLFNGLLIVSQRSFEVGEEIMFTQV